MTDMDRIQWPGWSVVRLIGRGSFGAVYEIRRELYGVQEKAALKHIRIPRSKADIQALYNDGYDEESITAAFESRLQGIVAEYALMRKLNGSTNVVNCDDFRVTKDENEIGWDILIKMELLTPLTEALNGPISEETAVKLGTDLCTALSLCEANDILHRDIKPQNIFVSARGDYKLGDFGIAKTVEKTMGGTIAGSYKYMAPEVCKNQPYGHSADIYSLGLVLYWMLNRKRMPFMPLPPEKLKAGMDDQARNRRLSGKPLPPPADGSPELQRIVLKACAYNPKDRYRTAEAMLADLRALENGSTVKLLPKKKRVDPGKKRSVSVKGLLKKKHDATVKEKPAKRRGAAVKEKPAKKRDVTVKEKPSTDEEPPKKKRSLLIWLSASFALLAAVISLIPLLPGMNDGTSVTENSASALSESTEGAAKTLPVQLDWAEWADTLPAYVTEENYSIETRTVYSSRELETTQSTQRSQIAGWELYDTVVGESEYSAWSNWLQHAFTPSDTREVETQERYRYRDKETTANTSDSISRLTLDRSTSEWGDYGEWSSWSTTAVSGSDSRQVETQTRYRYRSRETTTSASSSLSGWTQNGTTTVWSDWSGWSEWSTGAISKSESVDVRQKTQYRSRTVTVTHDTGEDIITYGNWSSWGDAPISASSSLEVETRVLYSSRSRSKSTVYQYYRWTSWSDWSATAVSRNDNRDVDTAIFYRYRDRSTVTVYHFSRWSEWSEWSDTEIAASDTREVETATFYRYRDRITKTTWYFRRWTDWTEYAEDPVEASETVEVQTKTQYRYRSR